MNAPFVYGKIAFGKYFASRNEDIKRLTANFNGKVNTALVAPRRWGKSSLVYKASEAFSKYSYYRICYVDLFKVRSEKEFFQTIANSAIQSLADNEADKLELARKFLSGITPQLALGATAENDFDVELEFSGKVNEQVIHMGNEIARKKGLTLLLCIDNFQVFQSFPKSEELLQKLRSAWEQHTNVVHCLIGSNRAFLTRLFSEPTQPLYKFCDLILLDKPTTESLATYICERFTDTGKTITNDFARKTAQMMENHPLYVQQLAHIVWENTTKLVDDKILTESAQELVHRNLILFQRQFDGLSNIQVNFLRAIADGVKDNFTSKEVILRYSLNSSASALRAIEGLETKDIIERSSSGITFTDPAFKLWLKQVWN